MKCIMVAATTQDGFIASDDHPHPGEWTSQEDKEFLAHMVAKHHLIVFGSNTYDEYGKQTSPHTLRVVLTTDPEKYAEDAVANQLVFKTMSPQEFVEAYKNSYDTCLVLGGAYVYKSFLEAGIIDEIYLTVEPVIFGNGKLLFSDKTIDQAVSVEPEAKRLNNTGTILRHYVLKK